MRSYYDGKTYDVGKRKGKDDDERKTDWDGKKESRNAKWKGSWVGYKKSQESNEIIMPFRSKSQQRYLFAKHPKIAKEFAKETEDIKSLPEKAGMSKDKDMEKARQSAMNRTKKMMGY